MGSEFGVVAILGSYFLSPDDANTSFFSVYIWLLQNRGLNSYSIIIEKLSGGSYKYLTFVTVTKGV